MKTAGWIMCTVGFFMCFGFLVLASNIGADAWLCAFGTCVGAVMFFIGNELGY